MRELVQRRAKHEPVAYLVGHREFYSLDFEVTPDVLIPRPDTETLVLELLDLVRPVEPDSGSPASRILDVGTGSGCIAVTVAVNRPDALVTAVDVSPAAIEVARANAVRHNVSERVRFVESDLFAALDGEEPFDVIASNPPYVPSGEWETLPDDVRLHEPRLALESGADGLETIRRIINAAPPFLIPGGHLLLEVDIPQAEAVRDLLRAQPAFDDVRLINDLTARPRVAHARKCAGG